MNIFVIRKLVVKIIALIFLTFIFYSCSKNKVVVSAPPNLKVGEGHLAVDGGTIWYKITGINKGIPVVLIHGGPGFSSYYLKSLEEIGNDRQVIRYDQLGGGKSERITDTAMFTIDHFLIELDSLRKYLKVKRWSVYGHSWGTILAIEYYRKYPDNVASLIFGSPVFNAHEVVKYVKILLTTLPDSSQTAVKIGENTEKYDDPNYQNAMTQFYSMYLFRHPVEADLDSSYATFNENIYSYMQGPSEFTITGTLKDYNSTSFLPKIKVPTLFTVGEFDEVGPELVKSFADKVPGAKFIQFKGSAHFTTWDARDENLKAVRNFLKSVDDLANN